MTDGERPEVDDEKNIPIEKSVLIEKRDLDVREKISPVDIFAEMEEKRQKLQIKSAQMSLSAYKEFRVEKDKNNQNFILEKEKNIHLEQAQMEHISLCKKIQRRDIIINKLRRNVAEENVLSRQGENEEILSRAHESNQEEKVVMIQLQSFANYL